jgi:hypothetical protein
MRPGTLPQVSKLNPKQKIGLGVAALVGLCCCGSGIGNALGGNDPAGTQNPPASVDVDQADPDNGKPAPEPTPVEVEPEPEPEAVVDGGGDEEEDVYYANCAAVRAAGADPIRKGDPGYSRKLDRDGDGVGCE